MQKNIFLTHFFILFNTDVDVESINETTHKENAEGFTSEGVLTLILPSNDRTDLLVRCTPCQRIYVGMDGWMRHKKVVTI